MWDEKEHPRDENGRFTRKEILDMSAEELKAYILENNKYDINRLSDMMSNDFSNATRILKEAISSGQVNLKIHKGNQDKHIAGTQNYKQEVANGRTPSILTANPDVLVQTYAGKGKPVFKKGRWIQVEMFTHSNDIGIYINKQKNENYSTNCGRIHYSNKGTHIVPDRRKK